jgi:hypothetical protein
MKRAVQSIERKPFGEIGEIHNFARNLVKKYYDIENDK